MKKFLIGLAAGAAFVSVPAMAQSSDQPFSGFRVGAEVGYDHLRSGSTVNIDDARDLKQSLNGVAYGAVLGYDLPAGENVRIGAEASIGSSSAGRKVRNAEPTVFNLGNVEAGRELYVGARLGFVTSPDLMLYVKGGYTNQRFGLRGTDGTVELRQKLDTDGWRLGAGAEYALSDNAYIGAEYRYSNYNKAEFDFRGETPDSSQFDIDTDRHQVMATAGVRF